MPVFILSKEPAPKVNWMEKQTKKAVLLHLLDENGNQDAYWMPKSQLKLNHRGETFEVEVSPWVWTRREPAKGMGCMK